MLVSCWCYHHYLPDSTLEMSPANGIPIDGDLYLQKSPAFHHLGGIRRSGPLDLELSLWGTAGRRMQDEGWWPGGVRKSPQWVQWAGQGSGEERARREGEDRKRGWGRGSGIRRGLGNKIDCGDSQGWLESWVPCGWGNPHTPAHAPWKQRMLHTAPFETI